MSDLRTAALRALEAMDELHRTGDTQVFDLCHRETTENLRAALAQPRSQGDRRLKNATTRLGIICYDAYARSHTGTKRWDIAAEAVRAALVPAAPIIEPEIKDDKPLKEAT